MLGGRGGGIIDILVSLNNLTSYDFALGQGHSQFLKVMTVNSYKVP